jgi:hypothetical protein
MARVPLPALATAVSFIDCVNRTDLVGLTELLHTDHRLVGVDISRPFPGMSSIPAS